MSEVSLLLVWGSIAAWNITALLFCIDSLRVYLRGRRECKALSDSDNGRKLVAIGRLDIARWFLVGAILGLATGLLGLYRLTIADLDSPQAMMVGAFTRVFIVVMFFAFWRAKRTNLNLYEKAAAFYLSRVEHEDTRDAPAD